MASEIVLPSKVEKRYRWLAWLLFLVTGAAATVGIVLAIVSVARLVQNRMILQSRLQTLPPLPYVYFCPEEQELFNFNRTVFGGCGDDISNTLNLTQINGGVNAGSSFRSDNTCAFGIETVNIMDRDVKGPVATTCVWFKNIQAPVTDPWRTDFYVMFDPTPVAETDLDAAYGYGVGSDGLALTSQSAIVYLSDFGSSNLAANNFFLRDYQEVLKPESQEKYEEGGVPLTPNQKSELRVLRTTRVFADGSQVVKYPVDGALSTYPLRNLTGGLRSLHRIPSGSLPNLVSCYVRLSISYDEVKLSDQSLRAIVLNLIGVIPGYIGYMSAVLSFFFIPRDFDPVYTLNTVFAKPVNLLSRRERAQEGLAGEAIVGVELGANGGLKGQSSI